MRYVILLIFIVWALWASISTGGLYELKQINPEYAHPNKSVPYLISKLNYSESNGFWDNYHVEQCSLYMPDWTKAEICVKERLSCEYLSPQEPDLFGKGKHGDIFSEQFRSCWSENRPPTWPTEWMRASRSLWRIGVVAIGMWITGGWDIKGEEATKWEEKNKGWAKPLMAWVKQGE